METKENYRSRESGVVGAGFLKRSVREQIVFLLNPPLRESGKRAEGAGGENNTYYASGFTILEALIAIAILSILMTAIAPVFVLAVGNRLQARRIELATQATKTYIAGVKAGTIAPPQHIVVLNEVDSNKNFNSQREQFVATVPPSTSGGLRCTNVTVSNPYCWNNTTSSLYCFDLDGGGCSSDSGQDLVIQAFRSASSEAQSMDKAYILGLRVYRAAGFSDLSPLVASDPNTQRTQLTFSGGLGNFKTPLVETATEIANDESRSRFASLRLCATKIKKSITHITCSTLLSIKIEQIKKQIF